MATVLDYLSAPEFSDDRLTEAINVPPAVVGRPAQLGIFVDTPIPTTYVKLGIDNDEITIIPARERGGEHNKNMREGRGETLISIPHFPLDDAITPSDLQNLLAFGEQYVFQTLENVYNDKLTKMRTKHDATHHHLDWGALRGLVVDGEGKQLVDLYSQFGISQTTVNFAFSNAATNVAAQGRTVKNTVRKNLNGAAMAGVRIFAGPDWFDAYVNHATVAEAYKYYAGGQNPARDDITDTFNHAGLQIERIDEEFQFRQANNTFDVQEAIPANEARAIPLGTPYFRRYIAPPDTIFGANRAPRPADRIFVSTDELPHGKGRDMHTESNVLPICTRPQCMIRLTMS